MKTTLNKIKEHKLCKKGFEKLLKNLGKTKADDEELEILTILDLNGLEDALWCLRAVEGYDREIRLYVVWCARQVQHLMKNEKSFKAINVAERYANGEATIKELKAASYDAWVAASYAAWDDSIAAAKYYARVAACNATWDDSRVAAWDATWCAARVAAWDSSRATDWNADWDAAWDSALAKQEEELRRVLNEIKEK